MALSHAEKHGAPSVGSHIIVDVIVAHERVGETPVRSKVHPANEDVAEVDVKATVDVDETKEQSIHIHRLNHPNYAIESVICNLGHATEVAYPLRAVNSVHKKRWKSRYELRDLKRAMPFSL